MDINRIIISLLLRKPFYGYILSSLNVVSSKSVRQISLIIGTSIDLVYNPDWFDALTEKEAHGTILHELLHLIFMHPLRRNSRDKTVWAMAADLCVNEHIESDMLPKDALILDKANRILGLKMEAHKSVDYYYDILIETVAPSSLPVSVKDNELSLNFPNEDQISIKLDEESEPSELNKRAAESLLEEITRQAADEGEIPGKLFGLMSSLYGSANVNWRNILKQFLTGKGRIKSRKSLKRISKRFVDMPGNKRYNGIEALVAIDESGSINDEDILVFYKELRVIKRAVKANLLVTRFDTDCSLPIPLDKYLKTADRAKHGGTDFRPIFNLADKINAKIVLIFTDGDGIFPRSVKQKTLWVLTEKRDIPTGLGDTVLYKGA